MAKILVWFPHGVHPPRMGSQVRALELLRALGSTGHEIQLATGWNPDASGMGWPREALEHVRGLGVSKIHVHRSRLDDLLGWTNRKLLGSAQRDADIGSWRFTPPRQVRWFRRLVREVSPDLLLMNYSISDPMVEAAGFDRARCILETHDLVLRNKAMQRSVESRLPKKPYHPSATLPEILDLGWFQRTEFESVDAREMEICSRYGLCLSISSREAARMRAKGAAVVHLPMAMDCGPRGNTWEGSAILAAGPNAFNVQGYLWFASKVLPLVLEREPAFRLELTGTLSLNVAPIEGVESMGVLPDLGARYLGSRFAICPVFGGTGQQVKIVEAMAHGLAVVALTDPAVESPLVHGVNGMICRDETEFAEACLLLWNDPAARARMGEAARRTVAEELSASRYADRIKAALEEKFPGL